MARQSSRRCATISTACRPATGANSISTGNRQLLIASVPRNRQFAIPNQGENSMSNFRKRDKTRDKSSIVAAKNRRELIAAGLNRRDLLKMGLLTSAGMLIPKVGLSAHPLTSAGFLDDTPQSRPTTPFVEEMPRLVIKQPTQTLTGPTPQIAPNTSG